MSLRAELVHAAPGHSLGEALRLCPLLWFDAPFFRDLAASLSGLSERPSLPIGACPAISELGPQRSLWLLVTGHTGGRRAVEPNEGPASLPFVGFHRSSHASSDIGGGQDMGESARSALRLAHWLLQRRAPLIWGPLPPVQLGALRLFQQVEPGFTGQALPLDGPSMGLSALLAFASALYARPLQGRVLASAELEPEGGLRPVGGIEQKAMLLRELPPGRILVALGQAEQWARALPGWTVRGFQAVEEVLHEELGPSERLRELSDEAAADGLLQLFLRAQEGRAGALCWEPIARATEQLRARPGLDRRAQGIGALVAMVASRYTQRCLEPSWEELHALADDLDPLPQVEVLAHLVQERANRGEELPPALTARIGPLLDPLRSPHAWKLRGAFARWLALQDQIEPALQASRDLTQELFHAWRPADCSYALCEWMRLAGVLKRPEEFESALRMERRLSHFGLHNATNQPYLDLAAGTAAARLGRRDEAHRRLSPYCGSAARPELASVLVSRARRQMAALEGRVEPCPGLSGAEAALDKLRRGCIDLERCLLALGPHEALGRRLASGDPQRLLLLYPY